MRLALWRWQQRTGLYLPRRVRRFLAWLSDGQKSEEEK